MLITRLLLVLEVSDVKPTYRKSWAGNFLMWSDLTIGPSCKVKRWFTGCGELSFRWVQICIGSSMRRSACIGISLQFINIFYHVKCEVKDFENTIHKLP